MASKMVTTNSIVGMRVLGGKKRTKKIGKVRRVVFHPKARRVVGFIVKRPDLLLMFHRKDVFVSIDGYDLVDGRMVIRNEPEATDKGAFEALGVDWDSCVLWVGLPVMTQDGTDFGHVGNVTFNRLTGAVDSLEVSTGAASNAMLGKRTIPADLIKGFRVGMGADLVGSDGQEENGIKGAILVDDAVKAIDTEGGIAEKAGHAAARAGNKVETSVKPAVHDASVAAGKAVNKGAYAAGKQIGKSKNMFSEFKEEYDKARGPKEPKESKESKESKAGASAELTVVDEEEAAAAETEKTRKSSDATKAGSTAKAGAQKQSASAKQASSAKQGSAKKPASSEGLTSEKAKKAVAKQAQSWTTMFSEFKEEYDKARHDA